MTAMELWNALVAQLLARGYSTLNAYETVHNENPGLWAEAVAESMVRHRRGAPRSQGARAGSNHMAPARQPSRAPVLVRCVGQWPAGRELFHL